MAKKKNKKKDLKKVASGQVKIRIFMNFGSDIRHLKAEYTAREQRDADNNLVAINEEFDHNEDVDFSQEEVYNSFQLTLGLNDLSKDQKIKKLNEKIERHKKRVNALEKHPELNILANIWDEKRLLNAYEIFLKYVEEHGKRGAYFQIENGVRVYSYESKDGFLIPIWHGVDNVSDHVDFTRKRKTSNSQDLEFEKYLAEKGKDKMIMNGLIVLIVIFGILCVVAFMIIYMGWDKHDESFAQIDLCMEKTTELTVIFDTLMGNTMLQQCVKDAKINVTQIQNKVTALDPKNS